MRKTKTATFNIFDDYYSNLTLKSLIAGYDDERSVEAQIASSEADRMSTLLPHQITFLEDKDTRHLGLVAGFGSGKSYALAAKMLQLATDNPGYTGIAMEPTFGLLSDVLIPQALELFEDWKVDFEYHKGASSFEIRNADGSLSTILLRSFENYNRIRGINAAWAIVDEVDTVKPQMATQAFRLLQGRIRTGPKPQIAIASTPEGFGFLHNFFIANPDNTKRLIKAKTTDNPYLPASYIQSLRDQYPPELIEAYLNGEFVNLAQSSVFSSFNRSLHATSISTAEPNDTVMIGLDFNIGQSHGCFGVIRNESGQNVLHVFGEYKLRDTFEVAKYLQQKFPAQISMRKVLAFPDAAGAATSTSSTTTDHQILRQAGLEVRTQSKNPAVSESIAHANSLFHRGLIKVNVQTCPELASSLERWSYDQGGRPEKGGQNDYSHSGDAFRYLVWGCMGGGNRIQRAGFRVY